MSVGAARARYWSARPLPERDWRRSITCARTPNDGPLCRRTERLLVIASQSPQENYSTRVGDFQGFRGNRDSDWNTRSCGIARIWYEGAAQNYMKLFVAHKMTRNNTLNKVHVAATEPPQLLSRNTNMFGEATAQSRFQILC